MNLNMQLFFAENLVYKIDRLINYRIMTNFRSDDRC